MKVTSAVFLTFVIVLAAICPLPAEANGVTVKIPADPVDCSAVPSGIQTVQEVTLGDTTYYYVVTTDGDYNVQFFANCLGTTLDSLNVIIDNVPLLPPTTVTNIGTDFDASDSGTIPTSPASLNPLTDYLEGIPGELTGGILDDYLSCPAGDASCTGMVNGDVGGVITPEPTVAELLLFTFGLYLIGFGGWKGWKALAATWFSQRRLAAS